MPEWVLSEAICSIGKINNWKDAGLESGVLNHDTTIIASTVTLSAQCDPPRML